MWMRPWSWTCEHGRGDSSNTAVYIFQFISEQNECIRSGCIWKQRVVLQALRWLWSFHWKDLRWVRDGHPLSQAYLSRRLQVNTHISVQSAANVATIFVTFAGGKPGPWVINPSRGVPPFSQGNTVDDAMNLLRNVIENGALFTFWNHKKGNFNYMLQLQVKGQR